MFVERVRRRAAGAGVLALALVLASCGAVEDALGTGDDEGSDTSVVAAEATDTTVTPVFEADAYCALSHEADVINAEFTAFDDPVQLEGFITSLTGLLNQATPPPEIVNEFTTFRTAYVDLQAQLAAGGYSIAVLQASPILSDANVNAAITAVDAHDLALCGPAPSAEAPPTEEAVGESTGGTGDPLADALASGDFSEIEPLFSTPEFRAQFIEGFMSSAPGATEEQVSCFLDASSIELLVQLTVDSSGMTPEMQNELTSNLEGCGIAADAFQAE